MQHGERASEVAAFDLRPPVGEIALQLERFPGAVQAGDEALLAVQRIHARPQYRQDQEFAVGALQPRPQTGAQERGFAGAGGGQNCKQRLAAFAHLPQGFDTARDVGIAAEKHCGIVGVQGRQAGIDLAAGCERKRGGIEACAFEADDQPLQPRFGQRNRQRLAGVRHQHINDALRAGHGEVDELVFDGEQVAVGFRRGWFDQHRDDLLAQHLRGAGFARTPWPPHPFR